MPAGFPALVTRRSDLLIGPLVFSRARVGVGQAPRRRLRRDESRRSAHFRFSEPYVRNDCHC